MDPRERIIEATLDGIDRVGVAGLTVRVIAAEADVNGAAINYYFGTQDRLLEEVLDRAGRTGQWGTLDELAALIEDNRGDVRAGLEEFVQRHAGHLAARALQESNQELPKAIHAAYRLALGRAPTPEENNRALSAARDQARTSTSAA